MTTPNCSRVQKDLLLYKQYIILTTEKPPLSLAAQPAFRRTGDNGYICRDYTIACFMDSKKSLVASCYQAPGSLAREQHYLLIRCRQGLNPFMLILTVVKTRMPSRISAGLLTSRTLSRAHFSSKRILNNAAGVLVFFNGTTNDDGVCFVWHRIASFQHAASLLAYRYTRNLRYEVSEDEHLQLLSGEGILHNKVPRKRKKCNKTNYV